MKLLPAFLLLGLTISAQDAPPSRPVAPKLLSSVDPAYTKEARDAGLEGTVSLYVEVDETGALSNIQVLNGLGVGLDEQAVEAVKQWRYAPGLSKGQPVRMARSADVIFRLPGGNPWRIRQAVYSTIIDRGEKPKSMRPPVLVGYVAPDAAACPADGGQTSVKLEIGDDGIPHDVEASVYGDALGDVAAKVVQQWRFQPGQNGGKNRNARGSVEFECGVAPARRIGGAGPVSRPTVASQIQPEYSEEGRRKKLEGNVRLDVVVDLTGHATDLVIDDILGNGLDAKAMQAVERWRFHPGMKDGMPVKVRATIQVSFHIL